MRKLKDSNKTRRFANTSVSRKARKKTATSHPRKILSITEFARERFGSVEEFTRKIESGFIAPVGMSREAKLEELAWGYFALKRILQELSPMNSKVLKEGKSKLKILRKEFTNIQLGRPLQISYRWNK